MDKVRVLRILEYVGTRECVEKTLQTGGVPSNGAYESSNITIRSAIIGQYPEILEHALEETNDIPRG